MAFLDSFTYAYNTTIEATPGIGYLYEKIPVLTDEEAFRQGLMRLKTVFTMVRSLPAPKSVSFVREIVRASPTLYKIVERNCPNLNKTLNPRGGKVPATYLGKLFAKTGTEIEQKLGKQIMREVQRALPKLGRALLGLDGEAAKVVLENVLSKSSKIIAKCPEIEWAWLAGWGGLVVGSVGYASLDAIGVNQKIQGSLQWIFRDWYGVNETDASTDRMTIEVLRRRLATLQHGTFDQANAMDVDVPDYILCKIKELIQQRDAAEQHAIDTQPNYAANRR